MIILDTNVVSELMRGDAADRTVLRWVRGLAEQPKITAVTKAEVLVGIALLPRGRRAERMLALATTAFADFECLPFDTDSAPWYTSVLADRRTAGRPITIEDAMIAAIARQTGAGLATRNTLDFDGLGLRLVDPWTAGPPEA
ncbi:PIN domain-containing protein [Tsukamurella ocularis]|uniref:type II toxin-antitoxin system VapC family toxin n=1 Tax=Tsukamurella ocularis TaxID=1970234 RepID=UPI0039EF4C6A